MLRLIEQLLDHSPRVVLDIGHQVVGPGGCTVHGGVRVQGVATDPITMQLPDRFDVVVLADHVTVAVPLQHRRTLVHNAVQHLLPGGLLVAGLRLPPDHGTITISEYDEFCADCDLDLVGRFGHWDGRASNNADLTIVVHRRTERFTIHDLVFEARRLFPRVTPVDLAARLGSGRPPVVVDTRTHTDRARFGVIAGSIHVPRTVLEWHLDPANGYRHPAVTSFDQPLVLVCNRGYSSSLGAASLVRIGFTAVADLIGGVHAWIDAGLPVIPADHDHLDW